MNRVIVSNTARDIRLRPKVVRSLARSALKALKARRLQLSIVFVTDSQIRRLNQKFLNHSWVTDVLAFPLEGRGVRPRSAKTLRYLGEIVISPRRAQVHARKMGVPVREELARYICHGILHLFGYRDKTKKELIKMRRAEDRLLRRVQRHVKGIF